MSTLIVVLYKTTVGDSWMRGMSSPHSRNDMWIHSFSPEFNGLSSLEKVGNGWMYNCRSLLSPDFNRLSSLHTVGDTWISHCTSLILPKFDGLSSLQTVSYASVSHSSRWTSVDYRYSVKSARIGCLCANHSSRRISVDCWTYDWTQKCPSLVSPDFSGLSSLVMVGCSIVQRWSRRTVLSVSNSTNWLYRVYSKLEWCACARKRPEKVYASSCDIMVKVIDSWGMDNIRSTQHSSVSHIDIIVDIWIIY